MSRSLRVSTLLGLALASLLGAAGPGALAARGAPPPGAQTAPAAAQPAATTPATAPAARQPVVQPRLGERRRRSYASCNRESHRRNLYGGARRRFLVRCKLGYERRRPAAPASAPALAPGQPTPPAKRP